MSKGKRVAAAIMGGGLLLSGCSAGNGTGMVAEEARCMAPASLQVQAAQLEGEDLRVTAGGVGAGNLGDPLPAPGPDDMAPLRPASDQALPAGQHLLVVDTRSGEVVETARLRGGLASTEPLEDGEYRIGLTDVDDEGWVEGLGSATIRVADGSSVTAAPDEPDRQLDLQGLALGNGSLHLSAEQAGDGPAGETSWQLSGPALEESGSLEDGRASISEVPEGQYDLQLLRGAADAPEIPVQGIRCRFGVESEDLVEPTSGAVSDQPAAGDLAETGQAADAPQPSGTSSSAETPAG